MKQNEAPYCNTTNFKVGGILHVHPLLRCNLTCKHCYSDSAPNQNAAVAVEDIMQLIEVGLPMGYNVLSISGGEPFLYKSLPVLLKYAKELCMQTQLVTNGTLLNTKFADECLPFIDLVAISIDGDEQQHDEVRNKKGAYIKAIEGIKKIKSSNIPLGIVHAVTSSSWKNMMAIAQTVYEWGATLLQFHPLELSGRAMLYYPEGLSIDELYKAYIVFNFLQEQYSGKMHIQMDCMHRYIVQAKPELCGYFEHDAEPTISNFVKFSNSLVLNEKGDLFPFSYGMDDAFLIGNINNKNSNHIKQLFQNYFHEQVNQYVSLLNSCYTDYMNATCDNDLIVWSEYVVTKSKSYGLANKKAPNHTIACY